MATKLGEYNLTSCGMDNMYMKYVRVDSLDYCYQPDTQINQLIWHMLRLHQKGHNHVNLLVDVKVGDFNVGDYGCFNTDWHYDCVKELNHHTKHEHHTIYTSFCGTEWLSEDGSITKAGDGEIWSYGRELHRCPKLDRAGKRVVVRLTSTDLIKGVKL